MNTNRNVKSPRVHKHTLIEMNIAVFTARREAAHARVVAILRQEIFSGDKEKRIQYYTQCHALTREAILATRRSQWQPESPLLNYFTLIHDTIGVSLALARHESNLTRQTDELARLTGGSLAESLTPIGAKFSSSEKNLLDCLADLLTFGETLLQQDSAQRLQQFSADDRRRYELARSEYDAYYRHFPPCKVEENPPPVSGAEPQDNPC